MTTPPSRPSPVPWGPPGGWPAGGGRPPASPQSGNGAGPPRTVSPAEPGAPGGRRAGWRMLAAFVVAEVTFLLVSVLAALALQLAGADVTRPGTLPPGGLLTVIALPSVLAALVAILATVLAGSGSRARRVRRELALRWSWRDLGLGLGVGAAGLVLTIPASVLWAQWVGPDDANSALGSLLEGVRLDPLSAVSLFLAVWLVAPLCEEVLYRGVLWRALAHWRAKPWLIALVTTVVFSLGHLELQRAPLLLVITIPIVAARLLTGNLLSAVVAHQVNNFLPAIGLLLATLGAIPG